MAEYKNEELGIRLVVADSPTVRKVLRYRSAVALFGERENYLETLWEAAPQLVEEWDCPDVALGADLDELEGIRAADVVNWAALTVFNHYRELDATPKNS